MIRLYPVQYLSLIHILPENEPELMIILKRERLKRSYHATAGNLEEYLDKLGGNNWGYSCLSMIDKETIGILYESSVAHMTFQAVKLKDIIK